MDRRALLTAAAAGAAAQVALVIVGHFVAFVADNLFAAGGSLIALAAGLLYSRLSSGPWAAGAAASGGLCAVVGVIVSAALGDVPWVMLPFAGVAGLVGGLVGGALGRAVFRAEPRPHRPQA